jgi:chromate reductase, NAD(P)H dehydrogenase (quinone)
VTVGIRVLLISGSLRANSTNTAVLRTALLVAPDGVGTTLDDTLGRLPHFTPDDDVAPLDVVVAELRRAIHDADALLFSTPEYAGALPGSFKNLLDWTIGDDQAGSIYEKPVAWINASPREARQAHESLRTVLGYAHATIVEDACMHIPVTSADIGPDGLVFDSGLRDEIGRSLARLAAHAAATALEPAPPQT